MALLVSHPFINPEFGKRGPEKGVIPENPTDVK
jgi:hypothetical protein